VSAHLHSGLGEVGLHGDLLARVDVRVVRLGERFLELFELSARERRPDAPLLALLGTQRRRVDVVRRLVVMVVHLVRQPRGRCTINYTQRDSDVTSFRIYASWFSPPSST